MNANPGVRFSRWPLWVVLVSLGLAATEPAARYWLGYGLPEGQAASGLRILDDAFFIHPMRMFGTDFFSSYASCHSPYGVHSASYFANSFHWLYGVLGVLGRVLGVAEFFWLGWCNGVFAFVSLLAAFALLRVLVPRHPNAAFLVYAVGGGLGGILYLAAGAMGLHGHENFEPYFMRFAIHELVEGPHLSPILLFPRLYYTAALAMGYWALGLVVRETAKRSDAILAAVLLAATAWVNPRVAAPLLAVALLWLFVVSPAPGRARIRFAGVLACATFAGGAAGLALLVMNPVVDDNNFHAADRTMYLTAFASATIFAWPALALAIRGAFREGTLLLRVAIGAALGYMSLFVPLFFATLAYYGNGLAFWDYGPPPLISDWSLLGGVVGGGWALVRRPSPSPTVAPSVIPWLAAWFTCGVVVAVSAWGHGWFAQFGPLRVMPLLGIPYAALTAHGIALWRERSPRVATAQLAVIVGCGIVSIAVAYFCFMGPLGRTPGRGPFAWAHAEIVSTADRALIDRIPEGRYLAPMGEKPPGIADTITLRPSTHVVVGYGTLDHGDQEFQPLESKVRHFFDAATPDESRRAFVEETCTDFVYCPDTWPVSEATRAQLEGVPWLERVDEAGQARLYRVVVRGR